MDDRPAQRGRVAWVDAARGVGVALMVFTHACDAFLADGYRQGAAWHAANILSGLAAPVFLLLAGLTLYYRLVAGGVSGRRAAAQAARLLALGYWLQIPVISLRQLVWNQRPGELAQLFNVNILQVIAVSAILTLCLWAVPILRRPHRLAAACALAAIAVVALTPTVWGSGVGTALPLPVGSYMTGQPQTILPPFPFAAYFFAGCGLGPVLLGPGGRAGRTWAVVGGGAIAAGCLVLLFIRPDVAAGSAYGWAGSPYNAAMRAGMALVIAALCMGKAGQGQSRFGAVLRFMGRGSLGVYVLHLAMIYGSPVNPGAAVWLYRTLDPAATAALGAVALGASCLGVWGWRTLRGRQPQAARWLAVAGLAVFLGIFLIRP